MRKDFRTYRRPGALAFAIVAMTGLVVTPSPSAAVERVITTANRAFVPAQVTVQQGDTLRYVNADLPPHDVVAIARDGSGEPLFASSVVTTGGTSLVRGVERLLPGTYDFLCSVHPTTMRGSLTVTASGPTSVVPAVAVVPLPGAFSMPVAVVQAPASTDVYVVEKTGTVRALRGGTSLDPTPVLDLSREVSTGTEQGLLGLAFAPDGRHLFVNLTDAAGDTRVLEFAVSGGYAVMASRRELLTVDQPYANHNGGTLMFGPDGYLYIGLGDGGSSGDPGRRAQDLRTRLGKMLRIDPRPSGGRPFTVPVGNPYAPDPVTGTPPVPGALPEIWSYGLRNPWRFSFDRATGDLWIADVGQSAWEEINLQRRGASGGQNYGWNLMEGRAPYSGRPPGAVEPADHVPPVHEYARDGVNCSVTGGYVYRGSSTTLRGAYVFADFCDGRLRYVREQNGVVTATGDLGVAVPAATAFGEGSDGELYVASLNGTVFRIVPLS